MKTIFIGALPFRANEKMIRDLVTPYGPKEDSLQVFADWEHPTFEPYALVQVADPDKAVEDLDGLKIGSIHLRVHFHISPEVQNGQG